MKIILSIADSKGKNILFVSDVLQVYSLAEAVDLAKIKTFDNIYVVHRKNTDYLRANKKVPNSLDKISISSNSFFSSINDISRILSLPSLDGYWNYCQDLLIKQEKTGEDIIRIDGFPRATKKYVKEKLLPFRQLIIDASQKFSIDQYLLGAVLIDEVVRLSIFENIRDKLLVNKLNYDISVGLGQVKIETARGLIEKGYYNPNPDDENLNKPKIIKTPRPYLYNYIVEPKHNIFFSAARIKYLIDRWKNQVGIDLSPDIIATLYSLDREPHSNPQPNERGLQIASEFYKLAQEILQ